MSRLVGYNCLRDTLGKPRLDLALLEATTWLRGIMHGDVTSHSEQSERGRFVSLSHGESDVIVTDRYFGVADSGVVSHRDSGPLNGVMPDMIRNPDQLSSQLSALRGDFAGALFDSTTGRLNLFRDHFGARPMYYFEGSGFVAFSSHPAALLFFPGCSRKANRRYVALVACSHYRTFDNEPGESPFEDVRQVPIGSFVTIGPDDKKVVRYWDLAERGFRADSEGDLASEYRDLILNSVKRKISSRGKRGFTLSGGMDSSSVLASAVAITGDRQEAYSCVYEDKTYDESDDIKSILDDAVSHWHRIPVDTPDVFEVVKRMVALHGEPVATATWLSHFELIRQSATLGVQYLFGGLGGDELNAGEYEHFFPFFADLKAGGQTALLESEISAWAHHHDHPIFRKNREVALATVARVTDPRTPGICLPDLARQNRYLSAYRGRGFELNSYTPHMDHPFTSYLNNRSYQDLFRETTPCCLRAQDRHGAAYGIVHVNPFLDVDVVEFMFRIPPTLKVRGGVTKFLLREAMRGVLTESTRTRVAKTGWNAPAHLWFSGSGLDRIQDLVSSSDFHLSSIYDKDTLDGIIKEHREIVSQGQPRPNHMMFLWQLLNLEIWAREFNVELD